MVVNVLPDLVLNTNELIKRRLASTKALSGKNNIKPSKELKESKNNLFEKA